MKTIALRKLRIVVAGGEQHDDAEGADEYHRNQQRIIKAVLLNCRKLNGLRIPAQNEAPEAVILLLPVADDFPSHFYLEKVRRLNP